MFRIQNQENTSKLRKCGGSIFDIEKPYQKYDVSRNLANQITQDKYY